MHETKELLTKELETYGAKHISIRAKKLGLTKDIEKATKQLPLNASVSQRIYHILNDLGDPQKCDCGNFTKFESITKGYKPTCGKGCLSVKRIQREKSKEYQQSLSQKDREKINQKRKETCLDRFGHESQSPNQREEHTRFYSNNRNVEKQNNQYRETMLTKYGVEYASQIPESKEKAKETMRKRYGVDNALQLDLAKENRRKIDEDSISKKQKETVTRNRYEIYTRELKNRGYKLLTSIEEFNGVYFNRYLFEHECGNRFEYLSKGGEGSFPTCRNCFPVNSFKSKQEQEVFDFVKSYCSDAVQSDRNIIKPQELDIYIPSKKIAIEFCGLLWHSEDFGNKDKWYHFNKWKLCKEKGIRLITIWDSEWIQKRIIVENRVKTILGVSENKYIGARECNIREINSKIASDFCENHHLHGYSNSSVKLGAYFNNELVGVMTFGRRKITGTKSCEWEIVRFCTSRNVVGMADKFVKSFVREYEPEKLISYSDNRWDSGEVYRKIGMTPVSNPKPGYYYTRDYKSLEHRYKFTKQKLVKEGFDPNKTEWEIMKDLGYDKVWDCGVVKWEISFCQEIALEAK